MREDAKNKPFYEKSTEREIDRASQPPPHEPPHTFSME
jgi:hypothetical protein